MSIGGTVWVVRGQWPCSDNEKNPALVRRALQLSIPFIDSLRPLSQKSFVLLFVGYRAEHPGVLLVDA